MRDRQAPRTRTRRISRAASWSGSLSSVTTSVSVWTGIDLDLAYDRGFLDVVRGDDELLALGLARAQGDGQDSAHASHRAVEAQLADDGAASRNSVSIWPDAARMPDGYRKVEGRSFLANIGGGEVDRDPARRELEAAVLDRRPHALDGLPHGRVRQPDNRETAASPAAMSTSTSIV